MKSIHFSLCSLGLLLAMTAHAEHQKQQFDTTITKQVGAPYLLVTHEGYDASQ